VPVLLDSSGCRPMRACQFADVLFSGASAKLSEDDQRKGGQNGTETPLILAAADVFQTGHFLACGIPIFVTFLGVRLKLRSRGGLQARRAIHESEEQSKVRGR
jgi:hypothetical protein